MSRILTRKSLLTILIAFAIAVGFTGSTASAHPASPLSGSNNSQFCKSIGKSIAVSSGAMMYCFGPQFTGTSPDATKVSTSFGTNVNAANPKEDQSPSGVQADGQSETSIAATGKYVVEAWNDATAFFSTCPSPMNKEEGTGYGFSADGGKTFVDEGGLPNANCNENILRGDPSVEVWRSGGTPYFYISSLFPPGFGPSGPPSDIRGKLAMNVCAASGSGSSALLTCSQPIIVASSSQCFTFPNGGGTVCSFLDKEYMSIDPVRGRLYMSFTEFFFNPNNFQSTSTVELAVCDIGTPTGGTGPAGGTAGAPVCFNGNSGSSSTPALPYFVVAPNDVNGCENTGAYPAVDVKSGDVYVAYEHNFATNVFGSFGTPVNCLTLPTQEVLNYIPASCLTLTAASPCSGPAATNGVNVISLDATCIPGYNRTLCVSFSFPNDFPRIAVSDTAGTVSMVWNDAKLHPLGDIFLQSFTLVSLTGVQSAPVRVNSDKGGGLHFLPALRNTDANGNLNISFYQRANNTTAFTNVYAALGLSPHATSSPASNTLVTTKPSNWLTVASIIIPNFGDYTDNYVTSIASAPFTGRTVYVAWSDGRIGIPQPFEANAPV